MAMFNSFLYVYQRVPFDTSLYGRGSNIYAQISGFIKSGDDMGLKFPVVDYPLEIEHSYAKSQFFICKSSTMGYVRCWITRR